MTLHTNHYPLQQDDFLAKIEYTTKLWIKISIFRKYLKKIITWKLSIGSSLWPMTYIVKDFWVFCFPNLQYWIWIPLFGARVNFYQGSGWTLPQITLSQLHQRATLAWMIGISYSVQSWIWPLISFSPNRHTSFPLWVLDSSERFSTKLKANLSKPCNQSVQYIQN